MSDSARLTRTVLPISYGLLIETDAEMDRFTGRVTINLEVMEQTSTVVLHAKELDVELVRLSQHDDVVAAELTADPKTERIIIRTERPLVEGQATLQLRFDGEVSRGLLGYYRSTFVDESGAERVLAATQFEAPHARRAFPCFDEPEFKASFAITLVVAEGLLAISNGPEMARESLGDGRVRVAFEPTIPMSTYLVAWVAGPLELTEPVDAGGVALRVAHVPGKAHLTRFALDVAAFAIPFFADYYDIPYPGEKCDLVALPDFSFGAMENLGCVTFREARLLVDPDQVTLGEASDAALTIMHEIAHMWFGDLVTMKWWNGIWLNEAFATFMEHLGIDAYRPDWRTWDDFSLGRAAALDVDALANTRTVEYEVMTPDDADGMFDVLTYQKGGSILRMVEGWLGAEAFRAGVRHYLHRFRLGNTETTDLWDSLESATSEPVRRIMDSWIFQPGLPLVSARADGDRVTITQQRFTYEGSEPGAQRWAIPLRVRVHTGASSETRSLLLDGDSTTFDASPDALVVLDAGGEGFYRISYPREWRDRLVDAGVLQPLERFGLVDDLWAAVLAGRAPAGDLLSLARKLRGEQDLVVWRVLVSVLRGIARLVDGDALARLRTEIAAVLAPTFERLGWEPAAGDDARTRQLRGLVLDAMGTLVEDPSVIARARETNTDSGTDPDVAAACIAIVARGRRRDLRRVRAARVRSPTPQAQLRYLYAMGMFPTEELALRAVRYAMSDAVRPQTGPFVIQRALRSREHGPLVWVFVRDHWDEVRARFPGTLLPRLVEGVTWLVDDASITDVPRFLADHPVPEGTRVIAQQLERQRLHRALVDRERARLSAMLLGDA